MFQLCMICLFFLGLVIFYLVVPSEQSLLDNVADKEVHFNTDDDDEINHALLLIDILKSENLKFRQRPETLEHGTTLRDQSTRAATTLKRMNMWNLTNDNCTKRISKSRSENPVLTPTVRVTLASNVAPPLYSPMVERHLPRWPWPGLNSTTMPFHQMFQPSRPLYPLYRRRLRYPQRYWRRYLPDYYFNYGPPRRFYKEPATIMRPEAQASSVARTPMAISTKNPRTTNKCTTANPDRTASARRQYLTTSPRTTRKLQHRNRTRTGSETSLVAAIKDPVEMQVASELINEFKQMNITQKPKRRKN